MRLLLSTSMAVELGAVDPLLGHLVAAAAKHLPEDRMLRFELAAIEALTNAVRHGGPRLPDVAIVVTLRETLNELHLSIIDKTGAPTPAGLYKSIDGSSSDLEPLAEGGRGLRIIRDCTDRLEFKRKKGANILILIFKVGDCK